MIHYRDRNCTVFQSAIFQTNATVVETPDLILVVDPTWLPQEIEEIRQWVASRPAKPLFVLFTHGDYDHIVGFGAFPGATLIGSAALPGRPDREKILAQIREFDETYYIDRQYPVAYPVLDVEVATDGQTLQTGGTVLTFYQAPGHTRDGIFTVVEPFGILLAGDYLSDIEFPFLEDSVQYQQTLHKAEVLVEQGSIRLLIPGHGGATQNPAEMLKRCQASQQYIRELCEGVKANDEAALGQMIAGYPYQTFLQENHRANRQTVMDELHRT